MNNIVLFGPPGAGKGTQSSLLVSRLAMHHISTGDLFRAAMKNETALGLEAKKYVDKGDLVPDSVTIGMVEEVFQDLNGASFILDGFPRNVVQAKALDELLANCKLTLGRAIFLEVNKDNLIERLSGRRICRSCGAVYHVTTKLMKDGKSCDSCGSTDIYQRADDKLEAISHRLEVYEESTRPLKDYYQKCGKLIEVDGMGETEEVFLKVKGAVA